MKPFSGAEAFSSPFFYQQDFQQQQAFSSPLSSYLFVLVMEVFSRLLHSRFSSGYILYHPKTADLEISHLMFADDVMIFFDGSPNSLHGISETLDDFASWSGLRMNQDKTQLFFAGLNHCESTEITSFGFPIGSFPIRYLGLPLMHRKLKVSEYAPLIDKVANRFRSWSVRLLSFSGRLQLISAVITGIVNFWTSTFILPEGCIKSIESMCSRFLWSGKIEGPSFAKVAWSKICVPKKEGGLGMRSFLIWNKVLCLRLIWLLFSTSGFLWVAWHKHHHLRQYSFWETQRRISDSWGWKTLLSLRPLAERFIRSEVGNGLTTYFWYDYWTPLGPLIRLFGDNGPRMLRIPTNAKVADACDTNGWKLTPARSNEAVALHSHLISLHLPSHSVLEDEFYWTVNETKCNGFSSKKTWEELRPRESPKDWYTTIWFKGAIPKLAFTMWTANLDRLPTKVRLESWGMLIPTTCCLCSNLEEDRDHLFLRCDYSAWIWHQTQLKLDMPPATFNSWAVLMAWVKRGNPTSPTTLRKLVTQAIIYAIWRERNNRYNNLTSMAPELLFKDIDRQVRLIITARRQRKKFEKLMSFWLC